MASSSPLQQNTPVNTDLAENEVTVPVNTDLAENEVTVLDPKHQLFGCTFPLLRIVGAEEDKSYCVIGLPSGSECLIPIEATDRFSSPITMYPLPLSLEAAKHLLELYERIRSHSQVNGFANEFEIPVELNKDAAVEQEEKPREYQSQLSTTTEIMEALMSPVQSSYPLQYVAASTLKGSQSQPPPGKFIKMGDVGQYLGVSNQGGANLVTARGLKIFTNPLDLRVKLVSAEDLDQLKKWLNEIQR